MLARIPLVMLVNNNVQANTVKEYVAYAKTPGKSVSYGRTGVGTSNNLSFEVLKEIVGMDVQRSEEKTTELQSLKRNPTDVSNITKTKINTRSNKNPKPR